jgi:hypothetical protein
MGGWLLLLQVKGGGGMCVFGLSFLGEVVLFLVRVRWMVATYVASPFWPSSVEHLHQNRA